MLHSHWPKLTETISDSSAEEKEVYLKVTVQANQMVIDSQVSRDLLVVAWTFHF